MLEVMAVKHIAPAIVAEPDKDVRSLTGTKINRILPPCVVWPGAAAVREHLKVDQVQMERMTEIGLQLPDLRRARFGTCVHSRRIEWLSVDCPAFHAAAIAEIEG